MPKKRTFDRSILIGENARITDSPNRSNVGMQGTIVDETKNTITIETNAGYKLLPKRQITIEINKKTTKDINETIETRIKKSYRWIK